MDNAMSPTIVVVVIVEILLMLAIPIIAAVVLRRRWRLPWMLAIAGAITFIGSQVFHLPANSILASAFNMTAQPLVVQAIVLGLSAGIFEEVARYLAYRFWQTDARSWREAVFFGVGHGGIEAIITGLLVVLTLVNMIVIVNAPDPTALGLPEGALAQVEDYWTMPLYMPFLAAAERVFAMLLHVSLSTLVVLCFHRRSLWPLLAAILWHAIANFVAVYVAGSWGIVAAEGALLIIALLSVGLLWLLRGALPIRPDEAPLESEASI